MLLKLENIGKKFKIPAAADFVEVLRDLNLEMDAGSSVAITGPSGSGKTTLMNIIGTLDKPSSGRIQFAGRDLVDLSDAELSSLRLNEIGFVFQLHHLLPQCTVLENVLIPTLAPGKSEVKQSPVERAKYLIDRVGLTGRINFFPAQLSGGELQRIAVVRSLINQPSLLLADEPTGSLDQKNSNQLCDLLLRLRDEEGFTLITVTHSKALAQRMEKVLTLTDGCLSE